jgi:two-component system, chemotaxis family, protein-glutamate methylesterase/glutaminase
VNKKVRVLVVDDSKYVVMTVTKKLKNDPEIEVVGSACNGREAVEKTKSLRPDVVTMDVIMPEMDGIEALETIMAVCPTPVLMLSTLTSEHAATTIKALQLGAVDFCLMPDAIMDAGNGKDLGGLALKIKTAASANINRKTNEPELAGVPPEWLEAEPEKKTSFGTLVVIGSSTGGPRALMQLVPLLPADIQAAILIVQHMPPIFTRSLAERIDQVSKIEVMEAREGSVIARGRALIAPGDFHMVINNRHYITLNQEPPNLGVRPSVDYTMISAANIYGPAVLGVILTGMGTDGTQGASAIKSKGGRIFAQDETTSAVYGMPHSVAKAGYVDKIYSIHHMAKKITEACTIPVGATL